MNDGSLFGDEVGATLVTTLSARATGAKTFGVTDWDDPQARDLWARLETKAAGSGRSLADIVLTGRMDVVGTIRRSQDIDARVRDFAGAHDSVQVVTLGIGLCNRAARLQDLSADWVGIDNQRVIALREELLPDDPTRLVAGSVTERGWLSAVDPGAPTVLIAEGLLMYLDRAQVTQLIGRIGDHFANGTWLVADMHNRLVVRAPATIAKLTGAHYRFGATSPQAFAQLSPGWHLVGVDDVMAQISTPAARASKVAGFLLRGMPYGVVTIERD